MVGMCFMMCLVGGLGCCEKCFGCSFFEIDIVWISVEVEWFSLMSEKEWCGVWLYCIVFQELYPVDLSLWMVFTLVRRPGE